MGTLIALVFLAFVAFLIFSPLKCEHYWLYGYEFNNRRYYKCAYCKKFKIVKITRKYL